MVMLLSCTCGAAGPTAGGGEVGVALGELGVGEAWGRVAVGGEAVSVGATVGEGEGLVVGVSCAAALVCAGVSAAVGSASGVGMCVPVAGATGAVSVADGAGVAVATAVVVAAGGTDGRARSVTVVGDASDVGAPGEEHATNVRIRPIM